MMVPPGVHRHFRRKAKLRGAGHGFPECRRDTAGVLRPMP